MILILDNRDSFTFNLSQALESLGERTAVVRSTEIDVDEVFGRRPAGLIVGPGPGTPDGAGCSIEVIRRAAHSDDAPPLLGICLGHQALAVALGGSIAKAKTLVHGSTRPVAHDGRGLLAGLPSPMQIARYNSLVACPDDVPDELEITATTDDGDIAGFRHRSRPLESLQGHPESVLCEDIAAQLFSNFVASLRR